MARVLEGFWELGFVSLGSHESWRNIFICI